jgi:DNA-binding Lrp family transcriptional regulator
MILMNKLGMVYRALAEGVLSSRRPRFVERELARSLGVSPDTVSRAVRELARVGAAGINQRSFEVTNFEKLLSYWAVSRKFDRDIIYSTYVEMRGVDEIEGRMPQEIAYTCFSAYIRVLGDAPADYGSVYVYATESALAEIKRRFPPRDVSALAKRHNLFVLRPDSVLEKSIESGSLKRSSVTMPQVYVDLWNERSWNAYEFLKGSKKKIDEAYAKAILEQR